MGWRAPNEPQAWRMIAAARRLHDMLVELYLPWARDIARRLCMRRNMPYEEVDGSAEDGLMRAARRYDPSTNVPFEAFARQHIRGAVLDMARRNERRPCPHGSRPRFELNPLGDVGEAELGVVARGHRDAELEEHIRHVLASISTPLRRNLFIRATILQQHDITLTDATGVDPEHVIAETREACREARAAAIELGLAPEDLADVETRWERLHHKYRHKRLLSDNELVQIAVDSLRATDEAVEYPDDSARPLVGVCRKCGAHVMGPKGIHGPLAWRCSTCDEPMEVS